MAVMRWDSFVGTLTGIGHVTPNMIRATFVVDGGYVPIRPGDESVVLYFSRDGVALRTEQSDGPESFGGWEVADTDRSLGNRNFTIRGYDNVSRELIIDIAEHPHGLAVDWFRKAEPGWQLLMAGPRSWYDPPADATRHVLGADLAALPALARILENTPGHIAVTVLAEVLDAEDLSYLPHRDNTTVVELVGSGNDAAESRLSAALAELDPKPDAYVWYSAESADIRAAKKTLRAAGFGRDRYDVVGYWRRDSERWLTRFNVRADEFMKVYDEAVAAGQSADEAMDTYEQALEQAGL